MSESHNFLAENSGSTQGMTPEKTSDNLFFPPVSLLPWVQLPLGTIQQLEISPMGIITIIYPSDVPGANELIGVNIFNEVSTSVFCLVKV